MTTAKLLLSTFKDAGWLLVILVVCVTTLAASSVLAKSIVRQVWLRALQPVSYLQARRRAAGR